MQLPNLRFGELFRRPRYVTSWVGLAAFRSIRACHGVVDVVFSQRPAVFASVRGEYRFEGVISNLGFTKLMNTMIKGPEMKRRKSDRRGAAAVEFAMVAPFFLLLIFGIVEFGRAMMVKQMLTNATREGARIAVVSGSTKSQAKAAVVDALQIAGVIATPEMVTVDPDPSTAFNNAKITVSVSVPFSNVSWVAGSYIDANLAASTSMRSERFD